MMIPPNIKLGSNRPDWKNFKFMNQGFTMSSGKKFQGAVYVHGYFAKEATQNMFYQKGYEVVDDIVLSDIVVLLGGDDINPAIYGEKPAGAIGFRDERDADDIATIKAAGNRFKVGICRGAQLLNCVPNNGKLWQDVDRHEYGDHSVTDLVTGLGYIVNSIHHQQMIPGPQGEIIAYTNLCGTKFGYKKDWHSDRDGDDRDVEAVFYPDTKSLCVQWHPEFKGADSEKYFFELMDRYYHAA